MRCVVAAKLEGGTIIRRSLETQTKNNKLNFKWKMKGVLLTVCPNVLRRPLCMGCVQNFCGIQVRAPGVSSKNSGQTGEVLQ